MWETRAIWDLWNPVADTDPKRDDGAETLRVAKEGVGHHRKQGGRRQDHLDPLTGAPSSPLAVEVSMPGKVFLP